MLKTIPQNTAKTPKKYKEFLLSLGKKLKAEIIKTILTLFPSELKLNPMPNGLVIFNVNILRYFFLFSCSTLCRMTNQAHLYVVIT